MYFLTIFLIKGVKMEYTTKQLLKDFEVLQFMAPYVYVIRKKDRKKGTLQFNHSPRIFYDFKVIK